MADIFLSYSSLRRVTRLLLDQGLAPGAAAILRGKGLDDIHVLDVDLYRAEDAEILESARTEARTCITLDHDFHAHLALSRKDNPSVVLLRVEGLNAAEQAALIRTVCAQCEAALAEGTAISADSKTIPLRRLPLR